MPPGVDEDFYAHVAETMPTDCRVVLDTSGEALLAGLASSAYLIKPNMHELGQLANASIENDEQIRSVARSLIEEKKVEVVVVSLGSGGAVLVTAEDDLQIRAPTVSIRSKVGAGDSTVAGIVVALSRGWELPEAVRFGVAAGSAAVTTERTELCRRNDTERLYEQMKAE